MQTRSDRRHYRRARSPTLKAFKEVNDLYGHKVGDSLLVEVGRQPFGPLPHTPMQWCAPGLSTAAIGKETAAMARRGSRSTGGVRWIDKAGQRYPAALLNALVMRGGREVTPMILDGAPTLSPIPGLARRRLLSVCRSYGMDLDHYLSPWAVDAPLPWSHVQSAYPIETLVRANARVMSVLS